MHERDILLAALEKSSPEERAAYLTQVCGDDVPLRSRVEALLRSAEVQDSFLEHPVLGDGPTEAIPGPTDRLEPEPSEGDTTVPDFLQPSDAPDSLGRLGQYEIREVVGRGGMGVVLKANDTKLNRIVALKVLAPELASNATARKRFVREARAAAAVSHHHVVTIYAVEDDPSPYLAMEFIDGQSLQEKIDRQGQLPLKEILRIGQQIAAGLAAAHGHGIIHRDIKPANILLQNGIGRVEITDFGLARAVDDVEITRPGEVAGTPQFMSPEQAQGQRVDARSDLFSLGSVLYTMCTGRPPFRADTTVAVLRRICDDTARPIGEVNPDVPEWLVEIIDWLLCKDPDDRFQTAAEVAELLGKHLAHVQDPGSTPFPGRLPPAQRRPAGRAHRSRFWLAAALILLTVVGSLGVSEATGVTRLAATVIRIATGEGTLVIEVDDPQVSITIDGEHLVITGAGVQEVRLKPGQYDVRATKSGQIVKQEIVTIHRDGRQVVKVDLEPTTTRNAIHRPKGDWKLPLGAPPPATAPFDAPKAKEFQRAWAEYLGVSVETTNSLGMKFVLIPPGEFLMGSSVEEQDRFLEEANASGDTWAINRMPFEGPQHWVRITKPFAISRYEVTRGQFRQFVDETGYTTDAERDGKGAGGYVDGRFVRADPRCTWRAHPGLLQTDDHPVVDVSTNDAVAFCRWLSKKESATYTLPTEAQWEYSCRAGTTTCWHGGDREFQLQQQGWYGSNSGGSTHAVGQLRPNAWGLYDIHGNVWEWCGDWVAREYYAQSPLNDPSGPSTGTTWVARGGDWAGVSGNCRSANRGVTDFASCVIGFRVAKAVIEPAEPEKSKNEESPVSENVVEKKTKQSP